MAGTRRWLLKLACLYVCGTSLLARAVLHAPEIEKLIQEGEYQEAVWLLQSQGRKLEAQGVEQEWLRRLKSARLVSRKILMGASQAQLLTFADAQGRLRVIFKPETYEVANINSEMAAFVVDQLLETRTVPMVSIQELEGVRGTFHAWVGNTFPVLSQQDYKELLHDEKGTRLPRNEGTIKLLRKARTLHPEDLAFFDKLIENHDRHSDNFAHLNNPRLNSHGYVGWDNGTAFRNEFGGVGVRSRWPIPSPKIAARLAKIPEKTFLEKLSPYLNSEQLQSFRDRRREALRAMPELESKYLAANSGSKANQLKLTYPAEWKILAGQADPYTRLEWIEGRNSRPLGQIRGRFQAVPHVELDENFLAVLQDSEDPRSYVAVERSGTTRPFRLETRGRALTGLTSLKEGSQTTYRARIGYEGVGLQAEYVPLKFHPNTIQPTKNIPAHNPTPSSFRRDWLGQCLKSLETLGSPR